jgi:hypothetical protein
MDILVCNGPSRAEFDLSMLDGHNVYGCNIVALEANVSRSIVIDPPVMEELVENGIDMDTIILAEGEAQYEPEGKPGPRFKNNAGVFGLEQMVKHGSKKIYVLGMDCILYEGDVLGNIYHGKKNFPAKVSFEDQQRRMFYLEWFVQQHPEVKFVFVVPDGTTKIHPMRSNNVAGLHYNKFKERLNA